MGLLPLPIEGEAVSRGLVLVILPATRSQPRLRVVLPSWRWEAGQLAAPPTGEDHLGCVLGISIIKTASSSH